MRSSWLGDKGEAECLPSWRQSRGEGKEGMHAHSLAGLVHCSMHLAHCASGVHGIVPYFTSPVSCIIGRRFAVIRVSEDKHV